MDEYTTDQVLQWYERLEGGILEFADHIPLTTENEQIKAPRLISYQMDACGLLDSVFRDLVKVNSVTVNGKTKNRAECDIVDYAYLHAQPLDLPNTRSVMLVSPPRYRKPFEPWKALSSAVYSPLPWWQDYNSLKHDLLCNIEKGTVGAALDALCALHQVLSRRVDLVPMLMRRKWFDPGGYTVDWILDEVGKGRLPMTFVVMTKLFAVPIGCRSDQINPADQFPENLEDLKPRRYLYRPEFTEFLGRY